MNRTELMQNWKGTLKRRECYSTGSIVSIDTRIVDPNLGVRYARRFDATDIRRGAEILLANGYNVASSKELAKARIEGVGNRGGCTREAVVYIPTKKEVWLTKKPLLMSHPYLNNYSSYWNQLKRFTLGHDDLEVFLNGALKINLDEYYKGFIGYTPFSHPTIPTKDFAKNELTKYLFEDIAKEYGDFLSEKGVEYLPVSFDRMAQGQPLVFPICHSPLLPNQYFYPKTGIDFLDNSDGYLFGINLSQEE